MSRHALLVANALLLLYSCVTPHLLLLYFNLVYTHIHMLYVYMLYFSFTPAVPLAVYVTAVILLYFNIFICTPALLQLYSYFSCCVCVTVCVCVPAYWPSRVCGAK